MDFYVITQAGEAHILSIDDDGRIITPLPASPPAEQLDHAPAADQRRPTALAD